jgi:hypothetical protein
MGLFTGDRLQHKSISYRMDVILGIERSFPPECLNLCKISYNIANHAHLGLHWA